MNSCGSYQWSVSRERDDEKPKEKWVLDDIILNNRKTTCPKCGESVRANLRVPLPTKGCVIWALIAATFGVYLVVYVFAHALWGYYECTNCGARIPEP